MNGCELTAYVTAAANALAANATTEQIELMAVVFNQLGGYAGDNSGLPFGLQTGFRVRAARRAGRAGRMTLHAVRATAWRVQNS